MSRRQRIVTWSAIALVVIILVAAGVVVSLTQTSFGQNQVRAYVQSWVSGKVRGKFYVGKISGGLFNGVTIDSIEIRDEEDSLFLATGPIHIKYDARDLLDRRILLSHVDIQRPVAEFRQHETDGWNFQRIFPSGPKRPPGTARGFGEYIVIDSADIHDGTIIASLTWHPNDTLRGAKRDSVIRHALGSLTRRSPGNQWLSEINRTREGFSRIYRFTQFQASFNYARIADPDSVGRFLRITKASLNSFDPPLSVKNIVADVRHVGDSVWLTSPAFSLTASKGRIPFTKIVWGSHLPVRYDVHVIGDQVAMSDIAWVYPTLPRTGGGRLDLYINNFAHPRVVDYAIKKMDVRTTKSHLTGDMTYGVGGPVLVLKDVQVEAFPLDFDLIKQFNGKPFPYPWRGQLTGYLRGSGGPLTRFKVEDTKFTFNDANVPGAVARGSARGMLDILYPAFTVFHGFAVNIETLDFRTMQFLNPLFPELKGTVSGTTVLDSSWLDVRFSNADIVHHDGDLPTSRITGSGRMTSLPKEMQYDVDLQAAPVSMTTMHASYPSIPLRGNFTGPIKVSGVPTNMDVVATLTGAGGTLSFNGKVDGSLPDYGYHGSGTLADINLRTLLENPKAPRTMLAGDYSIDFIGDSLVVGAGTIKGSVHGTAEKLKIASSTATVRLDHGIAHIDTLLVQSDVAHATASGDIGLIEGKEGKLGFVVSVDSLADVKRYIGQNTPISGDSITGSLRIAGEVKGTKDRLTLDGTLTGRELYATGKTVGRINGKFSLADLTGTPNGDLSFTADTIRAGAFGFTSLTAEAKVTSASSATFDANLASEGGVISTIAGNASLTGDTTRLHIDSGNVVVSNGNSYRLEAPINAMVTPRGGTLDSLLLRHSSTARLAVRDVSVSADSVRGNLRTDSVDLGVLEAFIPGFQRAHGQLVANVDVRGSVKQPVIDGQFRIKNGAMTLTRVGLALEQVTADVLLERDTVFIQRLSAETSRDRRGTLGVQGFVGLAEYTNPVFALRMQAKNFHVVEKPGLASLDISTDQDLTLTGPYKNATVTGAVRVDRGTIYIPELITKQIVDLSDPEFAGIVDTLLSRDRKLLPETPSEFARNLTLENVAVNIGDGVWLRSSEANVKLGGSLNVTLGRSPTTGDRSQLALEGTLNAVRGTYRLTLVDPFVQPTFDVESGSLRFFGTPDLNPTLDIRAIHTIRQPTQRSANLRDIRVRVTIGGNLSKPTLTLDNPDNLPLSQSDLLSYLITGEPAIALDNPNGLYASQLASFALRYGGNLLTSAIPRNLVDIVELQTGRVNDQRAQQAADPYLYSLLNSRAIVGKQVGNNWFIGLSTGLCVVNANNFKDNFGLKIEYRFNSIYTAQAGVEPGSSDITCARNAPQIQQQTPRQLGFDFFRTWRF
ncbi:MAG TPA: translocation/assembly module TamB domain-containing protein [Gemmatimonadaceae bacterium]|nr:translocation/assembly module TamB domain-containing protein [Gemmatimonadaceae bacterium]